MELAIIVTVLEAFPVLSVWDKVAGAMVCSILNAGYAMALAHCNVELATEQENENNQHIINHVSQFVKIHNVYHNNSMS